MLQSLAYHKSIGFGIIAVIFLSVLALVLPAYWTQLVTRVLIMALFATSLNIQVGYAGMFPLGHSMFLGFGAYSFGLLITKGELLLIPAFLIALLTSIAASMIIGYLCLRGDQMTFGLLHLGFNILLSILINKWIQFTGGDAGIMGIPRPELFSDTHRFYYFVLIVVSICYIFMRILLNSPFAQVAQGLRENEERLRFLGINIRRFQLVLFMISGFLATIAGILLAMLDKGVFPAYISLTRSAEGLMMCLIGGMYSFLGPSLGAAIVVIISTVTSNYINQWQGLLGIIIIVCVIGFRGGILGRSERKLKLPQEEYHS
jgi:branched-chain amino acid transport system permease protein